MITAIQRSYGTKEKRAKGHAFLLIIRDPIFDPNFIPKQRQKFQYPELDHPKRPENHLLPDRK